MEDTSLSRYMDGLYAYATVLSRNSALAADLVQDTYVRALKAKESLRPDSNVKSWLFTILRNIWLNQLEVHFDFSAELTLQDRQGRTLS